MRSPALHGIGVPDGPRVRIPVYADDVSSFVLCFNDIEVIKKALERYKEAKEAKIKRNKTSDLPLGC